MKGVSTIIRSLYLLLYTGRDRASLQRNTVDQRQAGVERDPAEVLRYTKNRIALPTNRIWIRMYATPYIENIYFLYDIIFFLL